MRTFPPPPACVHNAPYTHRPSHTAWSCSSSTTPSRSVTPLFPLQIKTSSQLKRFRTIPLQPVLNAPEVDTLFSHPLSSFLSTAFPERAGPRGPFHEAEAHAETAALELQYHTYSDVPWPWPWLARPAHTNSASRSVRMHRFLTGREAGGIKPIYGLTACVSFLPHSPNDTTCCLCLCVCNLC